MRVHKVRLGDVLALERNAVDIDPDAEYRQIGIRSFGKGIFHREPCSGSELSKLRYFEVNPDRLVVSNIMAWEGAIGISTDSEKGLVGSARFLSYQATGDVDIRYLNYYFQTPEGRLLIRSASTGTVARNQTLAPKAFENCMVPLPVYEEQQRIADKLDAANQRIAASAILRGESKKLSLALHDSILGQVSQWRPLGDGLALSLDEVAVSQSDSYLMAGVYGFGRGLIERDAIMGSDTKYARFNRLHSGTLVMSRLKAFEGALAMVPESCDGRFVSPEFPTFSVITTELDPNYLGHLCRWPRLWSLLRKESKGIGARRERVSVSRLLATEVPFPSLSMQRSIAASLGKAQAALQLARHQERFVATLQPALLDAAFSGRL